MISESDQKRLIKLARDTISSSFSNEKPDTKGVEKFSEKQGIFVTLHESDELRGCIGFPEAIFPLNEAVVMAAKSAAFEDPRFPPVEKDELSKIKIEISVLTIPEEIIVDDPKGYEEKVRLGEDGLIIRSGFQSGLLLPQVPTEQGWDIKEYLEYIGIKAGMGKDAYKDLENKLFTFQAQIFSED